MEQRIKKRRGPITLLFESRPFRWTVAVSLTAVVLAGLTFVGLTQFRNLKGRSSLISAGMAREEVEGILGPPVLVLPRTAGRGFALCWVDQLWQVDVLTGPDGRVQSVSCSPSYSFLRRITGDRPNLPP